MSPAARFAAIALLASVAAASAVAQPPETDIPYDGHARFPLGAGALTVDGKQLLGPGGEELAARLYTDPVGDGRTVCAADEADGLGQLRCWDEALDVVTLARGGRPGRLAHGGDHVAWVASPSGLPQVFVARVDGSTPPRALTNVGLQRVPGRAPAGFVPPPLGRSLRFDGAWLRWDTPDGPRAVAWR